MSLDIRLRYLWKPRLGDAEPPPQQQDGAVHYQQQTEGSSNSSEDIYSSGVCVPVGPQGPQPPTTEKEAREYRTESRDRWRLRVEIIAAVLGAIGLGALVVTLSQTRIATEAAVQSAITARRQLELAERPWITADIAMAHPVTFYDNGQANVVVRVVLENIGHSVATDVWVDARVVLFSHTDDSLESLNEPRTRRDESCERIRHMIAPGRGGLVLFPEQQSAPRSVIPLMKGYIDKRAFAQPGWEGRFIDPIIVGCVSYKSIFTSKRHVTGFVYLVYSAAGANGHFRVGETVPVEQVRLHPHALVGPYID